MRDYEVVVGIETHVELNTKTKIFCACEIGDAPPNTRVCPVCLGLPGALPALSGSAVALTVRAGLALGCDIAPLSAFDRKHYFYPDLPKGYQITQFFTPLCTGGGVTLSSGRRVPLTRIHLEEDAGKLVHAGNQSLVDFNRCGVPLIEIVSEPKLFSAEEAADYVRRLREILVYADVTQGRMNEGNLRADVNISVREKGETRLGERTEIKNLNSFQSVRRAVECEMKRQIAVIEGGGRIQCETLKFDQAANAVSVMRRKETPADYRYMPEPNLPPLVLSAEKIAEIRRALPLSADERRENYLARGLTAYAAGQMLLDKSKADAFDAALALTRAPVALANLFLSGEETPSAAPERLAALADMLDAGEIGSDAGKEILAIMTETGRDPRAIAGEGFFTIGDEQFLRAAAEKALRERPELIEKYLSGKENALRALMGAAMADTRGRGDARRLTALLLEGLERARKEKDG